MTTTNKSSFVNGTGTTNSHDKKPAGSFTGKFGYIFRVTNQITGTVFIGYVRVFGGKDEWRKYMGTGTYLAGEVRAYGVDNFSKEFIEWVDSEVQAHLRQGRLISKALMNGLCYNSNNAYSLRRDPVENAHNFAFKASFRSKARLALIIQELETARAATNEITEQLALQDLINAHKLAERFKHRRFKATGKLDAKDVLTGARQKEEW